MSVCTASRAYRGWRGLGDKRFFGGLSIVVFALRMLSSPALAAAAMTPYSTYGSWSDPSPVTGTGVEFSKSTAVHLLAMPSPSEAWHSQFLQWRGKHKNNDELNGQITSWRFGNGALPANPWAESTLVRRTLVDLPITSDIFCSGHVHTPWQRYAIIGGTEAGAGETGTKKAHQFSLFTNEFSPLFPAIPGSPHPDMAQRRWYPSVVSTEVGDLFTAGGSGWQAISVFGGRPSNQSPRNVVRARAIPSGGFDSELVPPDATENNWPAALSGHSLTSMRRSTHLQVLFGGRDATGAVRNEAWRLTRDENQAGVDYHYSFEKALVDNTMPGGRSGHASCVIDGELEAPQGGRLVVWGGLDQSGTPVSANEVWVYKKVSGGFGWHVVVPAPDPSTGLLPTARSGHGMIACGFRPS